MDEIDWLRREEQAAWSARIRQLRRELMEERTSQQVIESTPQEVALPATSDQPQKPLSSAPSTSSLINSSRIRKSITLKESSQSYIRKDGANYIGETSLIGE